MSKVKLPEITLNLADLQSALKSLPTPQANQVVSYSQYYVQCLTDGRIIIQARSLLAEGQITLLNEASTAEDFTFLLDPIRFTALLWQKSENVTFTFNPETKVLALKGTRNKISVLSAEDYTPLVIPAETTGSINIATNIKEAIPYASTDSTKPYLQNLLFKDNYCLATDGFKLYHQQLDAKVDHSLVVPTSFLTSLFKLDTEFTLDYLDDDGVVYYIYNKDTLTLVTRCQQSGYPENAIQLIPDYTDSFDVSFADLSAFLSAIKKVSPNTAIELRSVGSDINLEFADDTTELVLCIGQVEGDDDLDLSLNASFIANLTGHWSLFVPTDRQPTEPILFKRNHTTVLIMPTLKRS
jgi:hypothetical protein